jgi:hypothetical protein
MPGGDPETSRIFIKCERFLSLFIDDQSRAPLAGTTKRL